MKTNHDLLAEFLELFVAACGHRGLRGEALVELGRRTFTPKGKPVPIDDAAYEEALRNLKEEMPALLDELDRAPGGFHEN